MEISKITEKNNIDLNICCEDVVRDIVEDVVKNVVENADGLKISENVKINANENVENVTEKNF